MHNCSLHNQISLYWIQLFFNELGHCLSLYDKDIFKHLDFICCTPVDLVSCYNSIREAEQSLSSHHIHICNLTREECLYQSLSRPISQGLEELSFGKTFYLIYIKKSSLLFSRNLFYRTQLACLVINHNVLVFNITTSGSIELRKSEAGKECNEKGKCINETCWKYYLFFIRSDSKWNSAKIRLDLVYVSYMFYRSFPTLR